MEQHLFDFYELYYSSQTKTKKKCKYSTRITLLGNGSFLNQWYEVSTVSVFPTLSVILTLLDGCGIEKKYVINKSKKQTNYFLFYKNLTSNFSQHQKEEVHSEPCETSKKKLFGRFGKVAGFLVDIFWFLSVLIKQRFSPEILRTH